MFGSSFPFEASGAREAAASDLTGERFLDVSNRGNPLSIGLPKAPSSRSAYGPPLLLFYTLVTLYAAYAKFALIYHFTFMPPLLHTSYVS